MMVEALVLLAGFVVLAWSANYLVISAEAVAQGFGISPLIIGMVVIGFATSAPEMMVSSIAAWSSGVDLALGNALGSNIANIALVLGATAIIRSISGEAHLNRREFPVLMVVSLLLALCLMDQYLGRWDGLLLLVILLSLLTLSCRQAMREQVELASSSPKERKELRKSLIILLFSLIALLLSARLMVWGAVGLAHSFGVSELVIGLSIVALGTSLPELAASIASALRGQHALVLGNIIGSNLFNSLAVIGLPALLAPGVFSANVLSRDMLWVLVLTAILWGIFYWRKQLGRFSGLLLLAAYVFYQWRLFT